MDGTGYPGVDVKLVTFETQARQDQTWRTAAIFDDRPAAVAEAERWLGPNLGYEP